MRPGIQIDSRLVPLVLGAAAVGIGALVARFFADPVSVLQIAVVLLCAIVASVASQASSITRHLQQRVEQLEKQVGGRAGDAASPTEP